ncbi:MAG: sugar transferase [Paraprevotella sp.]|nr:sugar transferase [Paraprevotella sp.]
MNQVSVNMDICDGMNAEARAIKRGGDMIGALVGLIILSPLFLAVYILLKWERTGSVIYRQERIGYKGKPFYIFKFRTMQEDSEKDGLPRLAEKDDDRLTRVGKFLREHHLDELPQLWNVLCGDMSFVGPRPERRYFIDQIIKENPDYEYIFLMRPGLTSKATLYNGYTESMRKMLVRLQMDLEYFQQRSLLVDLKIIFTTISFILNGKKF